MTFVDKIFYNQTAKKQSEKGGELILIKRVALLSIAITYVLIVFGGFVASSESGMGCGPEWPLCNGDVIPEMKGETLIEFAHRVIGFVLAVMSIILFIVIKKSGVHQKLKNAGRLMISLLAIQIIAGALVVLFDLPTIIVTFHLLVAMVFLFALLWIYRLSMPKRSRQSTHTQMGKLKTNIILLLVMIFITIGFGAYIKHQHYGIACGWLDCGNTLLPVTEAQIFQTIHRLLAVITAIYTILLTVWVGKSKYGKRIMKRFLLAAFIIFIQLFSGVITILTTISISWAVVHLALATALFMIVADIFILVMFDAPLFHVTSKKQIDEQPLSRI